MVCGTQEARRSGPILDPYRRRQRLTVRRPSLSRHVVVSYAIVIASFRRRMEFDELQLSMKIIEALTAIKDIEGEEMAMSLLHPGAYLNKVYGNKYRIDITSISYKTVVSEVSMRHAVCINTACVIRWRFQINTIKINSANMLVTIFL